MYFLNYIFFSDNFVCFFILYFTLVRIIPPCYNRFHKPIITKEEISWVFVLIVARRFRMEKNFAVNAAALRRPQLRSPDMILVRTLLLNSPTPLITANPMSSRRKISARMPGIPILAPNSQNMTRTINLEKRRTVRYWLSCWLSLLLWQFWLFFWSLKSVPLQTSQVPVQIRFRDITFPIRTNGRLQNFLPPWSQETPIKL